MKLPLLHVVFFFSYLGLGFAQGENNNWYINAISLLNFNETPMRIDSINARPVSNAYNMTVSSKEGILLFFSEGSFVYNREARRMPNGTIFFDFGSTAIQPVLSFPKSDYPNQYYLFYMKNGKFSDNSGSIFAPYTVGELYYAIIDMSLDEGKGDIVPDQKDILLNNNVTGGMVALQGECGAVWVVVHEYNSNRFLAFEVTAQGIASPVVSEAGTIINYDNLQAGIGTNGLYASPQHDKLVSFHHPTQSTQLFDFDNTTGKVSNPITLPIESTEKRVIVSGAFSPEGKYFYSLEFIDLGFTRTDVVKNATRVIRFDLRDTTASAIQNSKTTVDTIFRWYSRSHLQSAPDGNIYGTIGRSIYRIEAPDQSDVADVVVRDRILGGETENSSFTYNFPNLVVVPTAPITQDSMMLPQDTSLCEGQQLLVEVAVQGQEYLWKDGSNSKAYAINAPGIYSVEVKKGNCTFRDTIKVLPYEVELTLPNDTTICENQPLQLTPITNANQLTWQDGSTNPTYLVNQAGIYTVTASQQGCSKSDSMVVQQIVIELELPNDTTLCENQSVELIPSTNANQLTWQDGSTNPTYLANQSGIYRVTASQQGCSKSDSVVVQQIVIDLELPNDTTICENQIVELIPSTNASQLTWQDGSTNPTYLVNQARTYTVTASQQGCSKSDSVVVQQIVIDLELPNDTIICENQNVELIPSTNASELTWQDSSTNPTYLVNQSGTYTVTASQQGCSKSDSVAVQQIVIDLELPNDTTICENQNVELIPSTNASQLTWHDGSTNPTYLVNQSGTYTVTASQQGCSKSDSVAVQQIVIELELPLDTTICEGTSIRLTIEAPDINKVVWNGITSTSIDLEQAGIYQVELFKESCSKQFELAVQTEICETCKLVVPNVFSPNQDGINDELPFLTNCPLQFFHIQIADRWGSIVYESNTPQVTWDGKFKGQIVENGIYTVLVIYQFMDAKENFLLTLPVQLMR